MTAPDLPCTCQHQSAEKPDRYVSFKGIDCDGNARRLIACLRRHIDDPELGPDEVAAGCGISVRYLHELLRDTNMTLGQWIRDTRLQAAMEDLQNPADRRAIGEIAYARGFTDQAQFSRAFRARFGVTPKEARGR